MNTPQQISSDIDLVHTIQGLVQTYQQIYVQKMQQTRNSVTTTRHFIDKISVTFNDLRTAYQSQLYSKGDISAPSTKINIPGIVKNDKSVAVLLSASEKLSGEINQQVFENFWAYAQKNPQVDIVIAGLTGRKFFEQSTTKRKFRYFDLPEENLSINDIRPLINHLVKYRQVNIFYGKFNSFISQKPVMTNISGDQPSIKKNSGDSSKHVRRYLFEPSPQQILGFFETQIFASLFKQTVNESYLAQIGSRIMTLESAYNKINDRLKDLHYQKRRLEKRNKNMKQLNTLVSLTHLM